MDLKNVNTLIVTAANTQINVCLAVLIEFYMSLLK